MNLIDNVFFNIRYIKRIVQFLTYYHSNNEDLLISISYFMFIKSVIDENKDQIDRLFKKSF